MYTRNNDDEITNAVIAISEDERTVISKNDITNLRRVAIDSSHTATDKTKTDKTKITLLQRRRNMGQSFSTAARHLLHSIKRDSKHMQFNRKPTISTFYDEDEATMCTYNSGADGHKFSEKYRKKLVLPILHVSDKKMGVKNGGACNVKYVTKLNFQQLSKKAAEADTLDELTTSLMSVGKTADDGNVSRFTKEGVRVYKEKNVLITRQRQTILIGKRDERDRYRITLTHDHGKWKPRKPTKKSKKYLQQANSVYDLPCTEEAIKWMHT